MLFVRLSWGGVVEVEDAVGGNVDGEKLVLVDCAGRTVARFPRLDVRAYGADRVEINAPRRRAETA